MFSTLSACGLTYEHTHCFLKYEEKKYINGYKRMKINSFNCVFEMIKSLVA